jgi:hypothetical protein
MTITNRLWITPVLEVLMAAHLEIEFPVLYRT